MWRNFIHPLRPVMPPFNDDANYTLTLQQLCEIETNKYGARFDEISDAARTKLFDFTYLFWSENADMKREFETDFLRHFYLRELGYETPALWKLKLVDAFKVWMPYYTKLMQAAIKAADLDWTLTDDYYIDYQKTGRTERQINDNNQTSNSGSDTRKGNSSGTTNTTDSNTSSRGGNDRETESGSMGHTYDKAIVRTDTPQDRFQQGGRGDEFALDALDVKMDWASEVNREKYRGTDTANNKAKQTDYNSTVNDTGNSDTTSKAETEETITRGTKAIYEGIKTDNADDNVHEITHESGRRGVAWIDIYEKYMNAIRNIEDEIFQKFDQLLFLQVWG